jgi:uncharacterized protein (TIGR03083 family)
MKTEHGGRTSGRDEIRPDRDEALDALTASTRQLNAMLRTHAHGDRPIQHLEWTVAQCVAHMLISNWMYADQVTGPGVSMSIDQTAELNTWSVSLLGGLDPSALVPEMDRSTSNFVDVVRALPPDAMFTWWSGAEAAVETAVGLLVGERLVHGWDVARALDVPWQIDPAHAAIAMSASFAVMPLVVDPHAAAGFDAVYEMRLRGHGRFELRFVDGVLTTSETTGAPDAACRISADPVALLLTGYGRVSQWRPVVRGRMTAWGRKPWLGLRLGRVLRNP